MICSETIIFGYTDVSYEDLHKANSLLVSSCPRVGLARRPVGHCRTKVVQVGLRRKRHCSLRTRPLTLLEIKREEIAESSVLSKEICDRGPLDQRDRWTLVERCFADLIF